MGSTKTNNQKKILYLIWKSYRIQSQSLTKSMLLMVTLQNYLSNSIKVICFSYQLLLYKGHTSNPAAAVQNKILKKCCIKKPCQGQGH